MNFKKRQLWIILILALIIRILFLAVAMPEGVEFREGTTSDAPFFDKLAVNIVKGQGFQDENELIFKPPAYPLFLAGVYSVFGHHYQWVRIIQALIWTIICGLIYLLAKETFNRKVGFIAGLVAAFYPPFIIEPIMILKETLFTFFLICFALFFIKGINRDSLKYFAASGFLLGLAALTNAVILYFPILILAYLLLTFENKKRAFLSFIVFIFLAILVVSPWSIRNYIQSHQQSSLGKYEMTIVGGGGLESGLPTYNIIKSNIETKADNLFYKFYRIYRLPHNLSYLKSFGYSQTMAKFIRGQADFGELFSVLKQKIFWLKSGFVIFYYIILANFAMGLMYMGRKWKKSLLLPLLIVYVSGAAILYTGVYDPTPRYKFYIMPYIIIFSAYGAYILFQKYCFKKQLIK